MANRHLDKPIEGLEEERRTTASTIGRIPESDPPQFKYANTESVIERAIPRISN